MRVPASLGLVAVLGACEARISGDPAGNRPDAAIAIDAAPPALDAPAMTMLGPWSTPAKISTASGTAGEDDVTLSSNTLELFFSIASSDGTGKDLYYASRPTVTGAWSAATRLPFNSATVSDETPRLSADDRTLYFASARAGGDLDVYRVTRQAAGSTTWSTAQPVNEVNTPGNEKWFMRCGTDRYLMVQATADAGFDLVEGTLGSDRDPVPLAELNSTADETGTFVTQDCLTVYFASARSGDTQIYRARRAALTMPWSAPEAVVDFASTGGDQEDPWLSTDEKTFAFASNASGSRDLYLSTRAAITVR